MSLFLVPIIAFIIFFGGVIALAITSPDVDMATQIRQICAQHDGVSRIDGRFVICRDGYIAEH